jgi:surface antigen Omp85-like protein
MIRAALLLAALLAAWSPARAQEGESYWGPIPADPDSSQVTYRPASSRAVEHVILTPFYVVTYPVYIATRVIKKGLVFADEHDILPGFGPSLPIHFGDFSMGPAVTAGGHSGIGGGGTLLYEAGARKEKNAMLRYITTTKGLHRGSLGYRAPVGPRAALEIGGGYRLERNARFFGIGGESREEDLSYFTQEQSWAGAGYRRRLTTRLTTEVKSLYTSIETRGPRSEESPALSERFAGALPTGYGGRSRGILGSALLRLDTTRDTGRPEPGVVAQGQAAYFGPTGGDPGAFWRYTGEAGAFVPLWFTDRTLALRGAVTWTGPTESDVLVFTRLATNHSGETLRGYRDYRWRDRGLLDLAAEYRWPVWAFDRPHGMGVDAFLFLDTGQVFGDWDQIQARLWRTSFGGGFRAILSHGFAGRLELARSRESTQIRLQADQMFDFKDMGLYRGNYHVAAPN